MSTRVNGTGREIAEAWREETLLAFLRDGLGLVGTKFGCGQGLCGACTVIVDGAPARACQIRAEDAEGAEVRTVEGLEAAGALHPVQAAWLAEAAPQCGFCQAGQIMTAVALLEANPAPGAAEIDAAFAGNLCRCGTYGRIRGAVAAAAEAMR